MPIEILAYEPTPLGILCLRRRELLSKPGTIVTEVTLNHEFLMSSYLTESERGLARLGLDRLDHVVPPGRQDHLKILVGGLGLGYTAAEFLKSEQVGTVEVVEFLPEVIGWLENDLIPLSSLLKSDSRLTITLGDIYARLAEPALFAFDLIAIDVDHSPQDVLGVQSREFYSEAGLDKARNHLSPGGVLGIWSYAEDTQLLTNMKKVFDDVDAEPITVWNDLIDIEQTDWLFFGCRAA